MRDGEESPPQGEDAPHPGFATPPHADVERGQQTQRPAASHGAGQDAGLNGIGPSPLRWGGVREAGGGVKPALPAVAAYALFSLLVPLVPVPMNRLAPLAVLGLVVGTTFAFMLLQLTLSRAIVRCSPKLSTCIVGVVAFTALWFVAYAFVHSHGFFLVALVRSTTLSLCITLAATFAGALLSRIIKEPNVLLPVALIAMPVDYLGAMTPQGFTHTVQATAPKVVEAVSVHVPQMGGIAPLGLIGPGDVLFMAFFFAVVHRLKLNERGTFLWMLGLLTVTMLYVLTPGSVNVAALVPMGLAVLLANGRYFRLKRAEVFASLYAGVLVLILVMGFYVYAHRQLTGR